jgi:hypothetical protein
MEERAAILKDFSVAQVFTPGKTERAISKAPLMGLSSLLLFLTQA